MKSICERSRIKIFKKRKDDGMENFYKYQEENKVGDMRQQDMERTLKSYLEKESKFGCEIHDMLAPRLVKCSFEEEYLILEIKVKEWMVNPMGFLHGGMMMTCCDMTMGLLAKYLLQTQKCVTVNLNINFIRSTEKGKVMWIKAKMEKRGKRIQFLSAQVFETENEKMLADCSAVFM